MAYHLFIPQGASVNELAFDCVLGSASTVHLYWTSAAEQLGLPIIAGMIENADSENGFLLSGQQLIEFKYELIKLKEYWGEEHAGISASEHFLHTLGDIIDATDAATYRGDSVYVG